MTFILGWNPRACAKKGVKVHICQQSPSRKYINMKHVYDMFMYYEQPFDLTCQFL